MVQKHEINSKALDHPLLRVLYRSWALSTDSESSRALIAVSMKKLSNDELLRVYFDAVRQSAAAELRRRGITVPDVETGLIAASSEPTTNLAAAPIDQSTWRNLPLTDAIIEFLKTTDGPRTSHQIWDTLAEAGCEVLSDNPVRSVRLALKKFKEKNPNDIELFGWGYWDLTKKHSAAKLKKLRTKYAGRGGRTTEEHAEATRVGMRKAIAEGRWRGHNKLTPEKLIEAWDMHAKGVKIRDIAKHVGVTPGRLFQLGFRKKKPDDNSPPRLVVNNE